MILARHPKMLLLLPSEQSNKRDHRDEGEKASTSDNVTALDSPFPSTVLAASIPP